MPKPRICVPILWDITEATTLSFAIKRERRLHIDDIAIERSAHALVPAPRG